MTQHIYSPLLTDLYQLTMAYGYWQLNMHEQEAVFHLSYRKNPFKGNHALAAGLGDIVEMLKNWSFASDDIAYLAGLKNANNDALFSQAFLDYLAQLRFTGDIDAVPEGTIVFPHEPLLRIQAPLLQCQLLESPLLNIINFQTLIATKASRICQAAQGDEVIEFGLRRAQGPDGALSASRAAYIGGCTATSNTLAGKLYDIPVRGTHAHSWVTAFPTEQQAFDAYISVMPHNAVLLVDTYGTLEGVANAIEAGKKLRQQGADLIAIRLDSGDMAALSIKARALLDAAGFEKTGILASNSLDEYVIRDLKQRGAKISAWGVGTHLVTAYDQPALDGVYKLSALQNKQGVWEGKLKLSDDSVKISNPGKHQIRRFYANNTAIKDIVYDIDLGCSDTEVADHYIDLLQPVFKRGKLINPTTSIHDIRSKAMLAVADFHRNHAEEIYSVNLDSQLNELKQRLLAGHGL